MKNILIAVLFLILGQDICYGMESDKCNILNAIMSSKDGYLEYKGKNISLSTKVFSKLLSEMYSEEILMNKQILINAVRNDMNLCGILSFNNLKKFEDIAINVSNYTKNSKMIRDAENSKQNNDKIYIILSRVANHVFNPKLSNEEIIELSRINYSNYPACDSRLISTAEAIIKLASLIDVNNKIKTQLPNIENANGDELDKYESDFMPLKEEHAQVYRDIQIGRELFPDLYQQANQFFRELDQTTDQYRKALNSRRTFLAYLKSEEENAQRREKEEQENLRRQQEQKVAQQKAKQEKEARQQRLKEKCTQFISSFGLSSDEYNYIIPGGGTFANELSLGEFLCMSKGAGTLTKFSKPGLFSDSYDFKYESDGKVTYLEFVEVIDDESKKHSESISRKNGTFLRLSKISSDTESKKLKSMTEHSIVMDPLMYGILIQAQVHSPELFQ